MHVRWERQESGGAGSRIHYELVALLVDGNPSDDAERCTVLCKLGIMQERFLLIPISKTRDFHQGLFWFTVDTQLENLNLDEGVCREIEEQIAERVPRPGKDWALWGVTCIPHIDC